MKILDGLRKELLKLDSAEKTAEWPKVEKELKDVFFATEDLLKKIKANNDEDKIHMDKIDTHIEEYKRTIEQIINEKNVRDAKELSAELQLMGYEIYNIQTGNAGDVQSLKRINSSFNSYHWKDPNKAIQLVNQRFQFATDGKTNNLILLLIQIFNLMPDDKKPKETLG